MATARFAVLAPRRQTRPAIMAGRDDAPGCHSARHARLSSIDSNTVESFLLTSPRSLEACARHGVRIDELQHRSCEDFVREAEGEGYVADVGRRRFRVREKKRQEQLATVKQEYQTICMARFQENVARVLADLTKGAKHFVSYTMAGIYTHEVYDELERAIAAEGRRYLRYPPPYAKAAGEPDPGLGQNLEAPPRSHPAHAPGGSCWVCQALLWMPSVAPQSRDL